MRSSHDGGAPHDVGGTTLIASDLDRTLIYSRKAAGPDPGELVAVERYDGADASWLTRTAARALADLPAGAILVPATTRTPQQYLRVRLPGRTPRYAITANGGVLLVDGEVDVGWSARVRARLATVAPLDEVWQHAGRLCRPEWTRTLRNAEGLFCYAVLERDKLPAGLLAEAGAWAQGRGWQLSLQGRKLYWVPRPLTKSAAVAEVAHRLGTVRTLAAGDSLLDADLLEAADAGIAARHGELVDSGWRSRHVQVTVHTGTRAGEEIVAWFAAKSATLPRS